MKMNGHATDQLVGSDRPTPVAEAVAVRVMPSDKESGEAALLNMPPLETNWKDDAALNEAACQAAAVSNDDAALSKAPPPADPAVEESMRFVDFVLTHAHEKYRLPLEQLYHQWQDLNEEHFAGDLKVPHLTIASGPPQALGFFKSLTDWGGRTQITIDARVVAARRRFVKNPWPAPGTRLFLGDLLLHEMVHQFLAEVEHYADEENAKHDAAFANVCNRIGGKMGLPKVYTKRRGSKDDGKPLANSWPFNVRPGGYYLGDVNPPRQGRPERTPGLRGVAGAMSFLRYLLDAGQSDKLAAIVRREAGLPHERTCTAKAAAEKGEFSSLSPGWLTWNNGCVRQLLDAIRKRRMFDLMPLLADALEAAGCRDELLLIHCRLPVRHTPDCWVVKGLTAV